MSTIAAVATPPGSGGIGIVRISGPGAKNLLSRVFLPRSRNFVNFRPWTLHRGVILDASDEPLDDVLAVFMPGPCTYTGEDVAEIHCHGGTFLVEAVLRSLLRLGARQAERGEFTRRSFLNGRLDLSQAEAVGELIGANGADAARASLDRLEGRLGAQARKLSALVDDLRMLVRVGVDFPEDEIEGLQEHELDLSLANIIKEIDKLLAGAERARLLCEGATIALAGPVNAGKSSLLNALSGRERAIVAPEPGTTRDYIEERLDLGGLICRVVDTAGLREVAENGIEAAGIARSWQIIEGSDLILLVIDSQKPSVLDEKLQRLVSGTKSIVVCNKSDLAPELPKLPHWMAGLPICQTSALTGENVDALLERIRVMLTPQSSGGIAESQVLPNVRQAEALERAREELFILRTEIANGLTCDCWLTRLDMAAANLGEIVELAPEDEMLDRIFSRFCIGK